MPAIAALWLLLMASPAPTLQQGQSGQQVATLQNELLAQGFSPGPIDGHYGPLTAAAVSRFESAESLPANGAATPLVLRLLVDRYAQSTPQLSIGASGPEVQALQALLNVDGQHLAVDGQFGPLTQAAVQSLQRSRGLSTDGIVGPLTWQAVFSETYPVTAGDTINLISAREGVPSTWVLAANGGSQEIYAGRPIVIPFAGWSATTTPALALTAPSAPSAPTPGTATGTASPTPSKAATGSGTTPSGSGHATQKPGGSSQQGTTVKKPQGFIPASALALWGNAGTPDIYVIALPTSTDTLRAALTAARTGPVAVALSTALWSSVPSADRILLATSSIRDVERLHPRWVAWLGVLSAKNYQRITALGAKVFLAPPVSGTAQTVAANASGGRPLLVQLQPGQTALLGRLLTALQAAGYHPMPLGQY